MYAKDYAVDLQDLNQFLREQITFAQQRYKETADRKRIPDPQLQIGDKAFISAKFLRTKRPTPKFSETHLGPYEILAKPSSASYTIHLPKSLH
jgi:hypothetical protein